MDEGSYQQGYMKGYEDGMNKRGKMITRCKDCIYNGKQTCPMFKFDFDGDFYCAFGNTKGSIEDE